MKNNKRDEEKVTDIEDRQIRSNIQVTESSEELTPKRGGK